MRNEASKIINLFTASAKILKMPPRLELDRIIRGKAGILYFDGTTPSP
jgi:hypothetical protein